jgi:hypothetical protein
VIEPEAKLGVLKELNRMNVTYTSLFPGLEGFAKSLRTNVFIRDSNPPFYLGPDYDDVS